jgi:hypothetical protein
MLNYAHIVQTVLLLGLTQLIMFINGANSFQSKGWSPSIKTVAAIITVLFHFSLLYYNITPFLYFWFMSSILHFYIHAYKSRKIIVESDGYTVDEIWHLSNQLSCLYYLYSNNLDGITIYVVFLAMDLTMLIAGLFGYYFNKLLYYVGSFMAAFFILCLRPNYDATYLTVFFVYYYFAVTIITFDNMIGRRLIILNIAGNAFISEAIMVYLLHNKAYDVCPLDEEFCVQSELYQLE